MKIAFETLDRLRAVKDCHEIDEGAVFCMTPIWRGRPMLDGNPANFMEYRKYARTGETHEGFPLFREMAG